MARDLFQRAIGESGGLFEPVELGPGFELADAERIGNAFAAKTGAHTLQALRAIPAAQIIKARFNPNAIIDGYVLPLAPYDAYREGKQNDVDLLIGSNASEGRLFLSYQPITAANLTQQLGNDFTSLVVSLIGPGSATSDQQARATFVTFEGEMRFGWDMWEWARLQADAGRRHTFLYRYTQSSPYRTSDKYFGWGASHGMEMPYVFDHLDQQALPWTAQDRKLASVMSSYWTNFAKSGDPNGPGLPIWAIFNAAHPQAMQLGAVVKPIVMPDTADLQRIGRLYWTARLVAHHPDAMLIAVALGVLALIVVIVRQVRRLYRRLSKPATA